MHYCLNLLAVILLCSSCQNQYKRYIPVYVSEDLTKNRFVERPDSLSPQHVEAIMRVFDYYRVGYRLEGSSVFYTGAIDQELLWNYTTKASDKKWLETHNYLHRTSH
jgi:hypothetical protein